MDVDHLVPLAWAWERGAHAWSEERRERFANDPRNLFAVDASANRSKGAQGPVEWLPPDEGFHCQYVLRFQRVALQYGLLGAPADRRALERLRGRVCDGES
jgi:hypothetical protein